ncbi:hypothetical protein QU814_11725 [Providencia rettgeri]|uniref:hypothetical protein n=1 Tax=Providencia rettgeri TaxID=587 RepID=UPI000D6FFCAC|nr:hypothetical protein [Providencia rettgeri]MDM9283830.1 hypothetical protein [Providencia rettgeri]
MQVKNQPLNVSTSQTSNINKSSNKSSGKVAVTASRVQNNTEQCPVTSKKKVCFSDVSQVKVFDNSLEPEKISTTNNFDVLTKKTPILTSEKIVHNQDIKKLKKSISTELKNINSSISEIINNKLPLWKVDTANLNSQLSKLTSSIKAYQAKLDSSSYKHHHSKQETLSKLNTSVLETSNNLELTENKVALKKTK